MSPPAFEPRRFGAYALTARLGHGGMAEVFRATREGVAGFARQCVVKRILGHHNEDPSFVDMFINEAKIAAQLTHPNIVQVYELGQVEGEFFIAMEYVQGRDLLRVLRELAQTRSHDPAIPAALAAYIARDTCRALQHAHDHVDDRGESRPIIHRDISPQNIMLSYDGVVKLVDFGIAKALGSMREETRTGALKGKFAYMAPEQIAGKGASAAADVFSTGVVLHEMLTGRRLFKGPSDYETLEKVRTMEVPTPSSIDPRIPAELDAIVMKSLERDRSQRYERAAQMARDLDHFLQGVRFSLEDMADFMRGLFPAEPREPAADHITKEYRPSASYPRVEGTPITGAELLARANNGGNTETMGASGRRTIFIAMGLAALVGTGAFFLVGRRGAPELTAPSSEHTPAHGGRGPEVVQLAPELRVVRVISEPPGARVFDGPRLLGEAPIDLKLPVDSPGVSLTLTLAGRPDLTYLVRPADAPELTLRLLQSPLAPAGAHSLRPPRPSSSHTRSSHNLQTPRVEIFDDAPASRP